MGLFSSKTETEEKVVDTTGNVNNNVVINGQVDVVSMEIVTLLWIICALKVIEFIYFLYTKCYRNMKKRVVEKQRPIQLP